MGAVDAQVSTTVIEGPVTGLPLGTCLERRFVLEEVLGRGGMGVVYKALDMIAEARHSRQPYVALKLLIPELATDERFKRLLFDEVEKARCLAHPNIINVREYFEDGENVFLTMEYLEGKTLDAVLAEFPAGMPPARAWPIIESMGEALAHAHANGIVHADIKPANVFITSDDSPMHGKAKIVDFGISKRASLAAQGVDVAPTAMTTILGGLRAYTPLYASPEQLEGGEPCYADDIYALACTIYQIYTGTHPFRGIPANHARVAGTKPLRPKCLDRRQWNALLRGLSFISSERIPTVSALVQGLRPRSVGNRHWPLTLMAAASALTFALTFWVDSFKGEADYSRDREAACPAGSGCLETAADVPQSEPAVEVRPVALAQLSPTPLRSRDSSIVRLDDDVIMNLGGHRAVSSHGDLAVGIDRARYRVGESLSLRFASAEFPYVYAVAIDPHDRAETIYPNQYQPDRPVAAHVAYAIPPAGAKDFVLEIGEPAGRHRLLVAASKTQLPDFGARLRPGQARALDSESLSVAELLVDVVR